MAAPLPTEVAVPQPATEQAPAPTNLPNSPRTLPPLRYIYNGHDYGEISCTGGPFTTIPQDHDWETIRTVLQKAALAQKWMLSTRSSGAEKIRLLCQPGTEYQLSTGEKQPGEEGYKPNRARRRNMCDATIVLRRSKRVDAEGNTVFTPWRITKAVNVHRCAEVQDRSMLVPNRLAKQQAPLHGVMDRIMRIARRGPDEYLAAHDLLTNALSSLDAAFNLKQLAGHAPSAASHLTQPLEASKRPAKSPKKSSGQAAANNQQQIDENAANSLVLMRSEGGVAGQDTAQGSEGQAGTGASDENAANSLVLMQQAKPQEQPGEEEEAARGAGQRGGKRKDAGQAREPAGKRTRAAKGKEVSDDTPAADSQQ